MIGARAYEVQVRSEAFGAWRAVGEASAIEAVILKQVASANRAINREVRIVPVVSDKLIDVTA